MLTLLSALLFNAGLVSLDEYEFEQCSETVATGVWWPDMSCASDQFVGEDRKLNLAWAKLMHTLPGNRKKLLIADERKWIAARDKTCGGSRKDFGDSDIYEYRVLACKYQLTRQRTAYLQKLR